MQESNERNKRSLSKIYRDLRQLISANFNNEKSRQLFLTLTYKENMRDDKEAWSDFKLFWQKLKRYWKDKQLGYVAVLEPQERGAWHFHFLLRSDVPFEEKIDYRAIIDMWGHGRLEVDHLNDTDHIGAYFIAYFKSQPLSDEDAEKYAKQDDIRTDSHGKKYIKGARLKWYDDYTRIYTYSKSTIKKPESEIISEDEEKKLLKQSKSRHKSLMSIELDKDTMYIETEQIKLNRGTTEDIADEGVRIDDDKSYLLSDEN